MDPIRTCRALSRAVDGLHFGEPVTHVYNPLVYARRSAEAYIKRYLKRGAQAVLLGMNPGPYGMAQTGVPFGEVAHARDWLGLEARVDRPEVEHPKRPIQGFDCPRSEVSGRRLWSWASQRFASPEAFFERFFIWNYCPLVFMEESGKNRTPDKLPAAEREPLYEACDLALRRIVEHVGPRQVIGVGKFAEKQAIRVLGKGAYEYGSILHPSPASPLANQGWQERAEAQLAELGLAD